MVHQMQNVCSLSVAAFKSHSSLCRFRSISKMQDVFVVRRCIPDERTLHDARKSAHLHSLTVGMLTLISWALPPHHGVLFPALFGVWVSVNITMVTILGQVRQRQKNLASVSMSRSHLKRLSLIMLINAVCCFA